MMLNKVRNLLLSIFLLLFVSCATTLNVRFTRPAQLDLNGANTIAVLPFKPCEYYRDYDSVTANFLINSFYQIFEIEDPDEKALMDLLQSNIEQGLLDSPYIKLVSSREVQRALDKGTLNPADVYLTGEMSYFNVKDKSYEEKKVIKPAEGNRKEEYELITYWQRNVTYRFRYQVIDSSDNHIISYKEIRRECISDSYKTKGELPSPYSIAVSSIRSAYQTILKELQPYKVIRSISLLSAKTKDKELKKRMKDADRLAADLKLEEAKAAFTEIYIETGLVEAGYNAAILTEAQGKLDEAERMMLEVYEKTLDYRVEKGLSDIRYEIQLATRLDNQIKKSASARKSDEDLEVDF